MSVYTASFRRFIKHTYSREELALIEAFERQRHRTGRVRYVIDSPADRFTAVLQAYIAYIQHLDRRDAMIVTPRSSSVAPMLGRTLRALNLTPRTYLKALGTPRCIGQILLLDAHAYCPSIPLYRSRLDAILSLLIQYVSGPNSVIIIQGTTHTRKNTRFRHYVAQASLPESIYQIAAAAGLQPAATLPGVSDPHLPHKFVPVQAACGEIPRLVVLWRPSHWRIPARAPAA